MYARLVVQTNKVPDFKSRLTRLSQDKGKESIPGFGAVDRKGQENEKLKLPINGLEEWFDESQAKLDAIEGACVVDEES